MRSWLGGARRFRFGPVHAALIACGLVFASPALASGCDASGSWSSSAVLSPVVSAQVALPAAAPVPAADADGDARAALAAIGRLDDADTALSLAAEGAALYEREAVKLDGYAYCSQAVELAEKGEFRESAQAASKALHVALPPAWLEHKADAANGFWQISALR